MGSLYFDASGRNRGRLHHGEHSMTSTPRTDAQQFDRFPDDSEADIHMVVDADFARQLERELNLAMQENALEYLRGRKAQTDAMMEANKWKGLL